MGSEPHELNQLEVLRALRISTWEASYATVHAVLTMNAFQVGFALWVGADPFMMGIIGAIPTFSALVQVVASYITERMGKRKPLVAWASVIARTLWLPILLLPFFLPRQKCLVPFVVLLLLSSVVIQLPGPPFWSWMADLVPADHRGRYFGRRSMVAGIVGMIVSLPAAWFLDLAVKRGLFPVRIGFAVPYGVAVLCGIASFFCLLRQPEPPMKVAPTESGAGLGALLRFYRAPFADAGFRRFMVFSAVFAVSQFIAGPFFNVYALDVLKLSYTWLQVLGAVASLSSLASMPLWGFLSDRFGNKPCLAISVAGVASLPAMWVFARPDNMPLAWVMLFLINIAGAFWAGIALTQFNMLIGVSPEERKSVYVGAFSAVTGVAGGIAPIVGGAIVSWLKAHPANLAVLRLDEYQVLFLLNTLLRLVALASLRSVSDTAASTAKEVLTRLGTVKVGSILQMRRMQRAQSEQDRLEAAQALRTSKAALALDEMIAALDDPALHVREEAAVALGEIGDARAVPALMAQVRDRASGVVKEAVDALGRIGSKEAVPLLCELLAKGESEERTAAARALGRIGSPVALDYLTERLRPDAQASDVEVEACLGAAGAIGDPSTLDTLVGFLSASARTVRIAAVRALAEMGDRRAEPALVAQLDQADDALAAHVAVALAMTGGTTGVRPLLDAIGRVKSPIARKQILNSLGALLGESESMYPILAREAFGLEETVARIIDDIGRTVPEGAQPVAAKRREAHAKHAIAAYVRHDYTAASQALLRLLDGCMAPGVEGDITAWAKAQKPGVIGPGEFLLVMFAVRKVLTAS